MKGYQWCANPYIETDMSRTKCIGCHQGSPIEANPGVLGKQINTNVGDFSFSIPTNREAFLKVLAERARLREKILINPIGRIKP